MPVTCCDLKHQGQTRRQCHSRKIWQRLPKWFGGAHKSDAYCAWYSSCRGRFIFSSWQPFGRTERWSSRATFCADKRAFAYLLCLDDQRSHVRWDCRSPLNYLWKETLWACLKTPWTPAKFLKDLYLDPLGIGTITFAHASARPSHADWAASEGGDQHASTHGSTPCPYVQYDSIITEWACRLIMTCG